MTPAPTPLQPGATIGIIGGGQLGRMVAMEARRMGYRTCVLDPDPDCPAGQVADDQVVAPYTDMAAARTLARRTAAITYEFEHVDHGAVAAAEACRPVYPSSRVLYTVQHRVRQKQALTQLGCPLPYFHPVVTLPDLEQGLDQVGLPAVLKTATAGYDGKGQAVIRTEAEALVAYHKLRPKSGALVLEQYVAFTKELSTICVRDARRRILCYPVAENVHVDGILDITLAPARIPPDIATAAQELTRAIAEQLDVLGLLVVEFFLTGDDRLLVNEIAPRPHNSGYYTLDACPTSQFEQLLRVLCHLPLGAAEPLMPSAMVNLLGDIWLTAGQPDFAAALALHGVKLHLYGKREARLGRKMGHLCALAPTTDLAVERALAARTQLARREG